MGEIIRKAHTHGARTQTNTGADTCKCWSCSTKNCQSESKRQQTNSELCKTRFLIFYNFYFHYIIITTFSFRITSRRVFVSGRETEGMMMHFVEYFECTLLLRMYTNGAALAAQLASPLSLSIPHNQPSASGSVSIVPFDLNTCTIRLHASNECTIVANSMRRPQFAP